MRGEPRPGRRAAPGAGGRDPRGAALVVPVLLAGCGWERPTPTVTVVSGTTSVRTDAACWSATGSVPVDATCLPAAEVPLPVVADRTVGISVDLVIAEHGWVPFLGSRPLVPDGRPLTGPYHRFELRSDQLADGPLRLHIVSLDEQRDPRGTWVVELVP